MAEMVKMAMETARMALEMVPETDMEVEKAMDRATVQDTVSRQLNERTSPDCTSSAQIICQTCSLTLPCEFDRVITAIEDNGCYW